MPLTLYEEVERAYEPCWKRDPYSNVEIIRAWGREGVVAWLKGEVYILSTAHIS